MSKLSIGIINKKTLNMGAHSMSSAHGFVQGADPRKIDTCIRCGRPRGHELHVKYREPVYRERVYLAGPMSGIPQMNFPEFDRCAETLRKQGYNVVSPAELDSPKERAAALASEDGSLTDFEAGTTWGTLLARDVQMIADEGIEAIVVLPGWQYSRGARLETFVARLNDIPILEYGSLLPVTDHAIQIAHGLHQEQPRQLSRELSGAFQNLGAGEIRVTNDRTGGQKGSKPERFDLIPWEQMGEVARLYAKGAEKYDDWNWAKGYAWSLSFASLIRHATLFWMGEETDSETGCSHMASVVFHALALMHFAEHHREEDNRCRI